MSELESEQVHPRDLLYFKTVLTFPVQMTEN